MFLASPFSPQVCLVHGASGGGRAGGRSRTAVAPLKDSWVNAETPFSFSSLLPPLSFLPFGLSGPTHRLDLQLVLRHSPSLAQPQLVLLYYTFSPPPLLLPSPPLSFIRPRPGILLPRPPPPLLSPSLRGCGKVNGEDWKRLQQDKAARDLHHSELVALASAPRPGWERQRRVQGEREQG